MSSVMPVSRQRHGSKHWQRSVSYAFAAKDALTPLVLAELPKALTALPIAFIAHGDGYVPAALMGLQAGENLLVSAEGAWVGRYIPARFRAYPFLLLKADDGQQVLCIDEASGLVCDGGIGEAFFTEAGEPTRAVAEIIDFLNQTHTSRMAGLAPMALLEKHHLIKPWPITVKGESGEKQIEGLFQIDEAALNNVPADTLLELRDAGALTVAYCQLLSMQHLAELGRLAAERARQGAARAAEMMYSAPGDTFTFGSLS